MSSLWSWIETVVGLVGSHPNWAMAAAFFFAIIEAVAVFGTFFPGTYVFMAVTGAAAAAGQPMLPYLLLAIDCAEEIADWVMPTLVALLPSGPKAGEARDDSTFSQLANMNSLSAISGVPTLPPLVIS